MFPGFFSWPQYSVTAKVLQSYRTPSTKKAEFLIPSLLSGKKMLPISFKQISPKSLWPEICHMPNPRQIVRKVRKGTSLWKQTQNNSSPLDWELYCRNSI